MSIEPENEFSEELLQAYIDGELDLGESEALLQAMGGNPVLKTRVCQLQHLKGLVKNAFPLDDDSVNDDYLQQNAKARGWLPGLVGLLLGVVIATAAYQFGGNGLLDTVAGEGKGGIESGLAQHEVAAVETPKKVLLHIDSGDAMRLEEALEYAEDLLHDYGEKGIEVELIANAGGVKLFKTGNSLYQARLERLSGSYENLGFIACASAIAVLRERGEKVDLLPQTQIDVTALDHVVKRLQEGWTYLKI